MFERILFTHDTSKLGTVSIDWLASPEAHLQGEAPASVVLLSDEADTWREFMKRELPKNTCRTWL
jgi:hypothetical protein